MAKNYSIRTCHYCNKSFFPNYVNQHPCYCSLECRFWDKVDIKGPDECWEWQAMKYTCGYGSIWVVDKHVPAHRLAWELENGPIPFGLWVLHHCDNRSCVNPSHLFLGTRQDNIDDMVQKNRHAFFKGEDNGMAKLTEKDVIEIRILLAKGETKQMIAKQFNVSEGPIYGISRNINWTHVI